MDDVTAQKSAYLTDYWTTTDYLSFSDFRPALFNIITTAQTPLTVGVFGPWGSGKTSLLRMLKQEIDDKGLPSLRTVWFTAWKYDRHQALWRAFILRVLDSLYPRQDGERIPFDELGEKQQAQVRQLDRLARSLYETVEWQDMGRWAMEWDKAGKELSKLPAFLLLFALGGENVAGKLGIEPDLADLVQRETQAHRMEQLASMEQFEETFRQALDNLVGGEDGRLVVFVDDLDRCMPEKAVEVLEAIKLFLEAPGTVFVLGMDREVIERGIEARYASFFRRAGAERAELPIRGDVYLQKIVQIPFHLPLLAVDDLDVYIQSLQGDLPPADRLDEMTRGVFAHGLFPNPRQVKRALNIFRLLRQIAGKRKLDISPPLLAKTVLIQTQWPELYRDWRQYPTLVQTLEEEYTRRPSKAEEIVRGRPAPLPQEEETKEKPQAGGLMEPYLFDRRKYSLLERMLAFPKSGEEGDARARFAGLSREQMENYVRLAGAVEPEAPVVEAPGDLLAELLSGDRAKIGDALARLEEQEAEPAGGLHATLRSQMQAAMRDDKRPPQERAGAGLALARLGDPRFRADAWFLPDDPLLGFVRIPAGRFLIGSSDADSMAYDDEKPQHEMDLPEYYIGRYPVTVAQFRAFVEGSGHTPEDERSLQGVDNHPVVYVTWYDAIKYCEWLTERMNEFTNKRMDEWAGEERRFWEGLAQGELVVTLPSEAQWEKAASWAEEQGGGGAEGRGRKRRYPWGDEPDPNRANYDDTGIGTTSAVGCFPGGASPYGVEDLSGNVWEWTCSLWGKDWNKPDFVYPYDPSDGREDLEAGDDVLRVLRGGSFDLQGYVRCAARYRRYPLDFSRSSGFRVAAVASPFRSEL